MVLRSRKNSAGGIIGWEIGHYEPNGTFDRLSMYYISDHGKDLDKTLREAMLSLHYLNGGN